VAVGSISPCRRYGDERDELVSLDLEALLSFEVRWPGLPCQSPRAFMAAQVAAVSTPPCELHAPVALFGELEPSLHATVSIALIGM